MEKKRGKSITKKIAKKGIKAIMRSILHWKKMIGFAKSRPADKFPDKEGMEIAIGETWTKRYCPLCRYAEEKAEALFSISGDISPCNGTCPLGKAYGDCEEGAMNAWWAVGTATTWEEWIKTAENRMLKQLRSLLPLMKVYFAHPCFNDKQRQFKETFVERIKSFLLERKGITIIDPFEYTPNIEGDTGAKIWMAKNIKTECIRLLEECDIIVALVDDNDTGVAFEAGYAHALNKPLILISERTCSTANAMLIGAAKTIFDGIIYKNHVKELVDALIRYK